MKPAIFEHHQPRSIGEAVHLLATLDNARLLAGGQSLMPMLNMRFAFPDHLIDLNRVAGLAGIALEGHELRIGAMTRQRDALEHPLVRAHVPLLAEALTHVGHRQTRNRGTIGGSLCHLDPAAELVAVALGLDACIDIEGPSGGRTIAMAAFPLGYMTPSLAPDEMLTALRIPLPGRHGHGFAEFNRRHGDFAIVSAASVLTGDKARITTASLTLGGVGAVPVRMAVAEELLRGQAPTDAVLARAAVSCTGIDAMDDGLVPGWYRQRLAVVMARRALTAARDRMIAP